MAEIDDIELKKRARRRLVGAAALALIAAIVLPMVMESEPAPPVRDIQVTMADRGADSRPIAPHASVLPPPIEEPTPPLLENDALPPSDDPRSVDPVIEPEPEPAPAPSQPEPQPRPAPEPTPEPAPAPRASAAPAPSENDEAERVRAILEGRAAAEAEAKANARQFVVQAAAFGDADKAAAMREDLRSRGFNAFVEDAGAVTRVRIGPFASRSDADAVAERLRALGIGGVVTNP